MAVICSVAAVFALLAPSAAALRPHSAFAAPVLRGHVSRASTPHMMWGGGGRSSIEEDYQKRQQRLQDRKEAAAKTPKGQVEVTFPQKGNKVVLAKQGEAIGAVARRGGVRIKFDCKNGRCGTCQVRLNGRAAAKVCQGAKVPGGATRKLSITLDNP